MPNPFNSASALSAAFSKSAGLVQQTNKQNSTGLLNVKSEPVTNQATGDKWYNGGVPTMRETVGRLFEITLNDQATGSRYQNDFMSMLSDPTSMYYSPYLQPTNRALQELASYGIDTSNINDDWFEQYKYLENFYNYGTTNTPTSPGKKASINQKAAYAYWQVAKQNELTKSAKAEWEAAKNEASYWANRSDRNYSDDDIIGIVYKDFAKKYPTLAKMDASKDQPGTALLELNSGIDYSKDALYGTIWAARNDGGTGNVWQDMAHSAIGDKNVWHANDEISTRLKTAPYTVGSTLDDAGLYYGKDSFDRKWTEENRPDERTATKKEIDMWNKVATAVDFTESAQAEAAKANEWLDRKLDSVKTSEDADRLMRSFEWNLDSKWKHLKQMDESMQKVGDLIGTSDAIDYSMNDVRDKIYGALEKNGGKLNVFQTMEKNGVDAGTDQFKKAIKNTCQVVSNMSYILDDSASPAERRMSVLEKLKNYTGGILAMTGNPYKLITGNEPFITSNYVSTSANLSADILANQNAQRELDGLNKANEEIVNKLDMLRDAYNSDYSPIEYLNILKEGEYIDNGYGSYTPNSRYAQALVDLYNDATGLNVSYGESRDITKRAKEYLDYIVNYQRTYEEDEETPWVMSQYTDRKKLLEAEIERTANAQNEYDKWQSTIDSRIELYEKTGMDATKLRAAKVVAECLPMFANYEATEWNAYNKYDLMMQSEKNGASFKEVKEAAEKGSEDIQEELAFSKWLKNYVTENKIELPDDYMSNLDRHIATLERDQTDTDYFLLQGEKDFNKLAEKGKKIEENLPIGSRLESEDENGASFGQYMTEREKDTYYYLLGKYGDSDPNAGYKKAYEYWAYLADPQYGVLHTRRDEAYQEEAKNMVNSGVPGTILANAISILSSPVEAIGGLLYVGASLLNDWELNPKSSFLSLGKFSQTVNQETAKAITEAIPEGAARDFALGAYEIVYNRLRSAANAVATGGLSIGGKFGKILTELVGAVPMATAAAALKIADAKEKKLDDATAYLLGGVTFVMEDFSEGLTRSNVKSIFSSGQDIAASSVKDIFKEWLTSSGLEEAFGETLTDAVEDYVDRYYAEAFSDHNALVQRIMEEQGLDPDNLVQRDLAEEKAREEEMAGLLHTALISYLSPGLEAATNTVKVAINDWHNIHVALNEARKEDPSVTRRQIVQEYNAYKDSLWHRSVQHENAQQDVAQEEIDAAPAAPQTTPTSERVLSDADNAFLRDLSVLDAVENSDPDAQATAIGVLFGAEEGTVRGDEAKAAAAVITDIFGDTNKAVKDIKGIMSGANQSKTNVEDVKSALKTAALSAGSKSNQVLTSDSFKTASLQDQAIMLAEAAAQDAVNEVVQREIAKNVLEARIAEKEADIIKDGALDSVDKLRTKADEAIRNIMQAKVSLSERQAETKAKVDAVDAAANEMTANPSNENNNAVKSALAELEKAISVEKEWEQHLEKVNQESADAENEFNAARDVAMRDIRQQAEAAVQQEDQARAEVAAQQAEQDRIAEQQRIDEQENKNFSRAQADEIIAENYANASEEDKEKIRGIVNDIRNESPITETEKVLARRDYVNRIAKKFGYDIEVGDTTEGGRFLFQNASVNPKTGKIILAKEATVSDAMYAILVHEVTHIAEQSGLYNDMADALLKLRYGDNADQIEADVAARQELYRNGLTTLQQQGKNVDPNAVTPEYARQELVADMMGELLSGDPELLNRFAAESPSVARRILDAIKSFLKKMVGIQDAPLTEAQRIVDTLEAALKEVSKNQGSSSRYSFGPVETNTIAKNNDGEPLAEELTGGTVTFDPARYSLSSFNDKEKARVRQALYSAKNPDGTNRFTRKQVDNYIDGATSLAAMIAADKTRLDFKASDNQVFLKPNNDYYFTLDASTLCAKRLLYQGTFDYVQHALPDEVFTPEDLIDLVNIMNDMGYETPCGICYVESRRRWLDTYAQKFLDELPDNADGFIEEYFKKATNEEKDTIREHYAEWNPTIDDLTTSDGLEKLRHANPFMYKAFVDAMNAKGSANPKVVQLRTEYRGDIGKLTANDIQKVKDIGGLRIQSFSDFETPHLLDMVQAVLDMSAVGLTSQAYTKVPNFAWVFGDTGIKINLSLIGKGTGLDENGNLVFDNREGINFDEAMKLRDRYSKNVGTILVGINDEHIIAAMGDPRIDFIIPFHKSGWSAEELRKMPTLNNYKDYTSTQNERVILERVNKVLKEWKTKNDTALKKWIEENGDNYIGYRVENTEKGYRIVFDGYKTESFQKHYERTKEKLSNLEPVGANQYWNFKKSGQWNAENYLKMCAEQHRMPKFYQFLVDNGDGSFSLPQGKDKRSTAIREGYWKTLIDFKMYENDGYGRTKEDGTKTKVKGSEQKEVTPNINMAEAYRVMNEYKLGRQMPNNPDGTPGKFIPMESNNSVPVAVPAAERYIETIRAKRGWAKPEGPGPNTLEADLPEDATAGNYFNPRANAFGASQAPAVLGNTEGAAEQTPAVQQNAMAIDAETGETVRFSLPQKKNPNYLDADGKEATNDAVEKSDVEVRYSLRTKEPPKNTIKCFKAFYVRDGKLYPPMVSNNTNADDLQKVTKATSGTMKGLETPVGVWLDADVGGIAVDENGEPLRTKKTGRLQVKDDKSGGNSTLAYRPGWHLGEWPDATQFYKKDPVTGKKKSVMPDDLVFAECEIAADVDYQLEALELGVSEKGGFNRTQAGLPRIPVDGYYKYRTNANPAEAPWYISGAMKVNRILTDEECRKECAKHGVVPAERYSHHDINLEEYGLKAGEVTPTENLERFVKNQASYDNDALLDRALNDERYSNAYVRRSLNFDDPTLQNEFKIDRISDEQVAKYRSEYKPSDNVRYSLPNLAELDERYMDAYNTYDDEEGEKVIAEMAEIAMPDSKVRDKNGRLKVVYHQTNADPFTVFDMDKARQTSDIVGAFFAPEFDENHEYGDRTYAVYLDIKNPAYDPEGPDLSKIGAGKERRDELIAMGYDGVINTENGEPYEYIAFYPDQIKSAEAFTEDDDGDLIPLIQRFDRIGENKNDIRYSLPSDAPYLSAVNHGDMEEAQRMVDEKADEAGYTLHGIHRTNAKFNTFEKTEQTGKNGKTLGDGFYISSGKGNEYDNDSYGKTRMEVRVNLGKTLNIQEPITKRQANKIYDKYFAPFHDDRFNTYKPHVLEKLQSPFRLMDYIDEAAETNGITTDEIFKWLGYDSVKDGPQYVVFDSEQIKLADPVTYDDDGNIIPLSERFNKKQPDIRYSLPSDKILREQLRYQMQKKDQPKESANSVLSDDGNYEISYEFGRNATFGNQKEGKVNVTFKYAPSQEVQASLYELGMKYDPKYRSWSGKNGVNPTEAQIEAAIREGDALHRESLGMQPQQIPQPPVGNTQAVQQAIPFMDNIYGSETSRPLEGMNPTMSTGQGPAQRSFGDADGMLRNSDEIDRFAKAVVSAQNSYFPDTNSEQIQRAIKWVRSLKATPNSDGFAEALQEVTRDNFDYRSADGQARMVAVMGMAVAKNDVMAQVALADAFNRQGTDLGRALQSRKLFKLMTPEGRIGTLQKMLQNTQDELDAKGTNVELKFSDWIYRAASAATEEGDMQKVMQAAAQELAEQLPANWKDRIRSIRMLSMLGNPRTHIRNVVGNALFVPVVSLKNKLGAIAELGVKQGERTKTLSPFLNKTVREFARQDAETMKNELTGEAKYNEGNAVQREKKAFKGLLQSVIDFNSNMLEKEDWTFLKGHYKRALGGWMQANGYTVEQLQKNPALLEKGRAYAIQEAQKATYRDFNKLAATMNDVSRKGGIAGFLVDAVLPFKKTPANILRRGIEYSPVGIMRSLTADLYHLKQYNDFQDGKLKALPEKAISPTQFIDKLCSGLSGTAIMAVGALLSSAGIVSCGLDDDEDKLEKEKGNQEYAFKFSILGHDYTFTMDWAAPMSMPFFVGAAIQEQLAQQDDFDVERLVNAFGNITEPVFNLSMLDGVNTLLKTAQSNGQDANTTLTQIGAKIASNYATSYVPSLLGAIARTVDDKRRKAFVESGKGTGVLGTFRYAMEQTENKIPGLSQTNIPYRDVWGNAETSGLVERILENFILPGYISEYKNDPILNEMDRLYTLTGDAGMIPSDPAKSITYKKQKYVLNAEQWDEYKAVRGQTAYEMLNNLIQTDDYKTADANVQTQMIKDAWSYADSVGKSAIIPDYELTSKGSNPAQSIAKDAKINGYKDEMIKALNAGDWEAYDTMVEALHQSEVEDSDIKTKIGNTYRDQYKEAYKKDDWQRMSEIEDILDNTGFSFDIGAWEKQVDQSR